MRVTYIVVLMCFLIFAACTDEAAGLRSSEKIKNLQYICDENKKISVEYYTDDNKTRYARVQLSVLRYVLINVPAASGTKYSDERRVWWVKGDSGFFAGEGRADHLNCSVQK